MYVLTGPTACKPPGTGAVQKYWNRGLPLIASGHSVSFLPVSVPRGLFVGVLGLRIVIHSGLAWEGCRVLRRILGQEFSWTRTAQYPEAWSLPYPDSGSG